MGEHKPAYNWATLSGIIDHHQPLTAGLSHRGKFAGKAPASDS